MRKSPQSAQSKKTRSLTDSEYEDIFASVLAQDEDPPSQPGTSSGSQLARDSGPKIGSQSGSQGATGKEEDLGSQSGSQREARKRSHKIVDSQSSQRRSQLDSQLTLAINSGRKFPTFREGLQILESEGSLTEDDRRRRELSQPPRHVSQRQRLKWLRDRRGNGTYVMCTFCEKWRFTDFDDPIDVPSNWKCSMNTDTSANNCKIPEAPIPLVIEEDTIHNRFTAGSIVWAKMQSFPWWPAIVDDCPDVLQYYWIQHSHQIPSHYHVVFFDKISVTRRWIKDCELRPYKRYPNLDRGMSAKDFDLYRGRIAHAKNEAEEANTYNVKERLLKYGFLARWKHKIYTPPSSSDSEEECSVQGKKRQKRAGSKRSMRSGISSRTSTKENYSSVSSNSDSETSATTTSGRKNRHKRAASKQSSRRSSRSSRIRRTWSISSGEESVLSDDVDKMKKTRRESVPTRRSSRRSSRASVNNTNSRRSSGEESNHDVRSTRSGSVRAKQIQSSQTDRLKSLSQTSTKTSSDFREASDTQMQSSQSSMYTNNSTQDSFARMLREDLKKKKQLKAQAKSSPGKSGSQELLQTNPKTPVRNEQTKKRKGHQDESPGSSDSGNNNDPKSKQSIKERQRVRKPTIRKLSRLDSDEETQYFVEHNDSLNRHVNQQVIQETNTHKKDITARESNLLEKNRLSKSTNSSPVSRTHTCRLSTSAVANVRIKSEFESKSAEEATKPVFNIPAKVETTSRSIPTSALRERSKKFVPPAVKQDYIISSNWTPTTRRQPTISTSNNFQRTAVKIKTEPPDKDLLTADAQSNNSTTESQTLQDITNVFGEVNDEGLYADGSFKYDLANETLGSLQFNLQDDNDSDFSTKCD